MIELGQQEDPAASLQIYVKVIMNEADTMNTITKYVGFDISKACRYKDVA
jgi:hypothetical protein